MCQIISTLRTGENSLPLTISTAEAEEEEIYKVEFFAAVISIEERQPSLSASLLSLCACVLALLRLGLSSIAAEEGEEGML